MRSSFSLVLLALVATSVIFAPSVSARRGWGLLLATSADDPLLIQRLVDLSPSVSPAEARRVANIAYTTGRELAEKWKMGASPTVHSFLINIGVKKGGYCYQFANELLLRLYAEKLQTLELHWAESDPRTDTEHNVILVTAKGQPFEEGIILDNWRRAGHLLWGPLSGDPDHKWQENKEALTSRLPRKVAESDRPR
jgi:hypothetical protein